MNQSIKPTDAELEVLQVIWANGPSSVRFVNDKLNASRQETGREEIGYTTTLKIMQIMAEKGLVTRNTDTRTHIYVAAAKEEDTQQQLLDRFVDNAFRGSAMKLVMQALGSKKASAEELDEIKAFINKIEKEK